MGMTTLACAAAATPKLNAATQRDAAGLPMPLTARVALCCFRSNLGSKGQSRLGFAVRLAYRQTKAAHERMRTTGKG